MNHTLPENVGVSSKAVLNLLKKLERLDMHSLILARGNNIFTEVYYAPYNKDTLHRMFSVTKSFTALAVGLLADEGKLSLDDMIVDYFPEYEPENGFYQHTKELTIRQMLTMTTCHRGAVYNKYEMGDWSESFFTTPPTHKSGTVFAYDTSSAHVLARLVEKLSGMDMLDYLRKKLFYDTDFSSAAYCIKDGAGTSIGGSGMMARPLDILICARLIMDGGRGRISEGFITDAISCLVSTEAAGSTHDEKLGYGYMIWQIEGGYAMNGMGGQLALCFPEKDFIAVTTADVIGVSGGIQYIIDAVREIEFAPSPLEVDTQISMTLNEFISSAAIKPLGKRCGLGGHFDDRIYEGEIGGMEWMMVSFGENEGRIAYVLNRQNCILDFGLGYNKEQKFPVYGFRCINSAQWCDERTLVIKSRLIDESIGSVIIQLVFDDGFVNVMMRKTEETYLSEYNRFCCMKEIKGEQKL